MVLGLVLTILTLPFTFFGLLTSTTRQVASGGGRGEPRRWEAHAGRVGFRRRLTVAVRPVHTAVCQSVSFPYAVPFCSLLIGLVYPTLESFAAIESKVGLGGPWGRGRAGCGRLPAALFFAACGLAGWQPSLLLGFTSVN